MQRTIIKTADGSHSLYVEELNEHYHSVHGAIQESKHVFIQAGLMEFIQHKAITDPLNILEIGLGTGLNALLTLIESDRFNLSIHYTAIEAYPLEKRLTEQLNYIELINAHDYRAFFEQIHCCEWNRFIKLTDRFDLYKMHTALENAVLESTFHLVYFDAFGPRIQPEMWTEEVLKKMFTVIKPGGCIVTYCAKGKVKRILKKVGFIVEALPGPPGKREMVRAWKQS